MGIIDKFEQGIERAVKSVFSRGGKAEVAPVEIASRIRRAMDDQSAALSQGRTLAPNVFTIEMGAADFIRTQDWGSALAEELCDVAIEHARSQNYTLHGAVKVTFVQNDDVADGTFTLTSRTQGPGDSVAAEAPRPAAPKPASPPRPAAPEPAPARVEIPPPAGEVPAPHSPTVAFPRAGVQVTPLEAPAATRQAAVDLQGHRYTLHHDSAVIGRSSDADITVDDPGASRRHVEVRVEGDHAYAVDLGSTNGTYIDGRRLQGSAELQDGTTLKIGHARAVFRWLPAGTR